MGKNRNILQFASQFLPGAHERYRDMCSLAAVGQLGGPEMCELNEHISPETRKPSLLQNKKKMSTCVASSI